MSLSPRRLQWIGLALFAISAVLPSFPYRLEAPGAPRYRAPDTPIVVVGPPGETAPPAAQVARGLADWALEGRAVDDALWPLRPNYFYALLPIWILALGLAGISPTARRRAGALLWIVTGGVIVLEARYLGNDYLSFLSGRAGLIETVLVWCFVVFVLVYRRPADRHVGAVGASVGAQAMLGLLHGLTLPATYARDLFGSMPFTQVVGQTLDVLGPGFFIGLAGLAFAAIPPYVARCGGLAETPAASQAALRLPD